MLTDTQVTEAIEQMLVQCDLAMETYKMLSARSVLRELGYGDEDTMQVLRFIAAGGFDYCLDAEIRMTGHHDARGEFPDWQVCYWGPDQLASRLHCLTNYSAKARVRRYSEVAR